MSLRVNKYAAKLSLKGIGRQMEKMKLGFGIVEQTKDDNLDFLVNKYFQHQQGSTKFLRSLRDYYECQRSIHTAILQLQSSMIEFYDTEWVNREEIFENFTHLSLLYEQYISKISDRIIDPFTQYLSRFPYYKEKLDKRGRKLLDYDSCKREVETLQTRLLRNKDGKDPKLIQRLVTLENDFQNAKDQYDRITDELYDDLTLLINNRVIFSAKIFEYFFQAQETLFHEMKLLASSSLESSKVLHERGIEHSYDLEVTRESTDNCIEKLSTILSEETVPDSALQTYSRFSNIEKTGLLRIHPGKCRVSNQISLDSNIESEYFRSNNSEYSIDSSLISTNSDEQYSCNSDSSNYFIENMVVVPTSPNREFLHAHKHSLDSKIFHYNSPRPKKPARPQTFLFNDSFGCDIDEFHKFSDEFRPTPINASFREEDQALIQLRKLKRQRTTSVHDNIPNILYRVEALFDYTSSNTDELSFTKGEHISVILHSTIEMDEGWLMGEHEIYRKKGIFPANHTRLL